MIWHEFFAESSLREAVLELILKLSYTRIITRLVIFIFFPSKIIYFLLLNNFMCSLSNAGGLRSIDSILFDQANSKLNERILVLVKLFQVFPSFFFFLNH